MANFNLDLNKKAELISLAAINFHITRKVSSNNRIKEHSVYLWFVLATCHKDASNISHLERSAKFQFTKFILINIRVSFKSEYIKIRLAQNLHVYL